MLVLRFIGGNLFFACALTSAPSASKYFRVQQLWLEKLYGVSVDER